MKATAKPAIRPVPRSGIADRVDALDWTRVRTDLDAQGCAVLKGLLTPEECRAHLGALSRRRAFPQPRRDGAPRLRPRRVQVLRLSAARPDRRAARRRSTRGWRRIANRWNEAMGDRRALSRPTTPPSWRAATRPARRRPTPLLLQYGAGDYNCLHQDLYGEHVFPLQVAILLSEPGRDFTGGEFVLTEQRPRMQSRAEVVPLAQGDAVDLRGAPPAGAGHARHLPRQPAARRQPAALRPAPHARRDLPRREMTADLFDSAERVRRARARSPRARCCCAALPGRSSTTCSTRSTRIVAQSPFRHMVDAGRPSRCRWR